MGIDVRVGVIHFVMLELIPSVVEERSGGVHSQSSRENNTNKLSK